MSEKIEIKEMTFEDFKQIEPNLQTEFDEFWSPSILKSELENPNSRYIVAKIDEEIVGFAGIILLPDDAEIMNIVTKKLQRNKGIGNLLLEKIIEMAKEERNNISLEVNEENFIAIKMYEKYGFKKVGLRKKYYNGKNDAIIMTKNF